MAGNSTTYVTQTTPVVDAPWLNDINSVIYNILGNASGNVPTLAIIKTSLGITAGTYLTVANNLSDLNNVTTALNNLGATAGVWGVSKGGTGVTASTGTVAVVLSTSPTLITPLLGTPTSGVLSNCTTATQAVGTNSTTLASTAYVNAFLRSYLAGLTLSTAGGSTTMSIAAGQAVDTTIVSLMNLAAFTKTTVSWAVGSGNGGLDTGASLGAASTWYHWYLIQRPDTGVVDALFSLSATSPTLPTNYTLFRRIGSAKTDGAKNWTLFFQDGNYFRWDAIVADINATNPGTNAVTRTLTVPTGIRVKAVVNFLLIQGSANTSAYGLLSDLSVTDAAVTSSNASLGVSSSAAAAGQQANMQEIYTNTSAQIRSRMSATSDANTTLNINTVGWIDLRGRDA